MFSCSTSNADRDRLQAGGNLAILESHVQKDLYFTIWKTLWDEGLRDDHLLTGKWIAEAYLTKLQDREKRKKARTQKKKARVQKKKRSR